MSYTKGTQIDQTRYTKGILGKGTRIQIKVGGINNSSFGITAGSNAGALS